MTAKARLTDEVTIDCPFKGTGTITTASENVFVDELGAARMDDEVTCKDCGAKGKIVTASGNVYVNDRLVARIGDKVENTSLCHGLYSWTGSIKQSSEKEFCNDEDKK